MLRLILVVILVVAAFFGGIRYEQSTTRAECTAGEGEWTGTICIGSELAQ